MRTLTTFNHGRRLTPSTLSHRIAHTILSDRAPSVVSVVHGEKEVNTGQRSVHIASLLRKIIQIKRPNQPNIIFQSHISSTCVVHVLPIGGSSLSFKIIRTVCTDPVESIPTSCTTLTASYRQWKAAHEAANARRLSFEMHRQGRGEHRSELS